MKTPKNKTQTADFAPKMKSPKTPKSNISPKQSMKTPEQNVKTLKQNIHKKSMNTPKPNNTPKQNVKSPKLPIETVNGQAKGTPSKQKNKSIPKENGKIKGQPEKRKAEESLSSPSKHMKEENYFMDKGFESGKEVMNVSVQFTSGFPCYKEYLNKVLDLSSAFFPPRKLTLSFGSLEACQEAYNKLNNELTGNNRISLQKVKEDTTQQQIKGFTFGNIGHLKEHYPNAVFNKSRSKNRIISLVFKTTEELQAALKKDVTIDGKKVVIYCSVKEALKFKPLKKNEEEAPQPKKAEKKVKEIVQKADSDSGEEEESDEDEMSGEEGEEVSGEEDEEMSGEEGEEMSGEEGEEMSGEEDEEMSGEDEEISGEEEDDSSDE